VTILMAAIFAVPHLVVCLDCSGAEHESHAHSDSPARDGDPFHACSDSGGTAAACLADGSASAHDAHLCLCLCHASLSPGARSPRIPFPAPEPRAERVVTGYAQAVPDRLDRPPKTA
jgi:hypothetical protein